jgi:hypothetical protein
MRFLKRFPWLVFAAILPILAGILLKIPRYALGNFTDGAFYLAYAWHFQELVLRYGFPYYATRFGGIFPDVLSGALFGPINGIWVLRYGLSIAVSVALYLCFKKRYGVLAGLLASLFWSFNPAALRLLCTTYVDSTAIPFLLLGCCVFASRWGGTFGVLLSGVLVALASSAHLYAAFAFFLLGPWFLASRWGNSRELLRALGWMVVGFLATFAVGCLWYWKAWSVPSLFSPTIDVMKGLANGGTEGLRRPLKTILLENPAWFVPAVLLLPVSFAAIRGGALMRGIAVSLLASFGFFWGGDLFAKAYVLSMPFYYSFLLPVTILAGATLCGELLHSQQKATVKALLFLGLLFAMVAPTVSTYFSFLSVKQCLLCCAVALVLILPAWTSLQRRLLTLLGVPGICVAVALVASSGIFTWTLGHYVEKDIPVLELVSAIQKEIPKAADDPRMTRFWWDDDAVHHGAMERRMIACFWLESFGKLTDDHGSAVPFLNLTSANATAISASGVERLVIFDQDPGQVTKAIELLQEKEIPFHVSKRVSLSAPSDPSRKLELAILEREKMDPTLTSTPWDLNLFHSKNHGRKRWCDNAIELTSGTARWLEFSKLSLKDLKKGERLRLHFKVEQGMVRFLFHDDLDADFSANAEQWHVTGDHEVELTASRDLHAPMLSVENMYPNGSRSRLLIYSVEKITPQAQ